MDAAVVVVEDLRVDDGPVRPCEGWVSPSPPPRHGSGL